MTVRECGTSGQHITVCASSLASPDHPGQSRTAYTLSGNARRVMNQTTRKHSYSHRALVDRGANGGIAGPNMRLLSWADGTVDIHGIDNHRVSATRLGSFAAVIKTHLGDRIGIWNQMASMPQGKTILSPVQMEAHRVSVNEKSPHITGRTPTLVTADGYITPMEIKEGLAYLHLRLPTDAEWESLPKITFTTDAPWRSKSLDAPIPPDWYDRQDRFSVYLRDSQFTENGDLKESVIQEPQVDGMPERAETEASRVDRDTIHSFLHNQVRDEVDTIFVYHAVGSRLYEHRLTETERREVHDLSTRPRRSTAKYSSPSGPPPSQLPHRSGGQRSKSKSKRSVEQENRDPPTTRTTDETVDDVRAPVDAPEDRTSYNNPAKSVTDDHPSLTGEPRYKGLMGPGLKGDFGPRMIAPSKINYDLYVRHFPGFSLNAIKKTFLATTQFARRGSFPGFQLKQQLKSPNPALHIPRRHEAVATDTVYGPKGAPAVDDGSTAAQLFVGRVSGHVWAKGCGKSDKTFVKVLYDCIRKFGAMDVLISDCAKAQISNKVQDLLRVLFIDDRQSEPYNKNQNFAERVWQDVQRRVNSLLNWSGAPDNCWLLALKYIAFVTNHVALERLGWRCPIEWLTGSTPDISVLLRFIFYEPVYYAIRDDEPGEGEKLGRFVGIAEGVGHSMTFSILTDDQKVISRSIVRTANKQGGFENFRALKDAENIRPARCVVTSPGSFKGESTKASVDLKTDAESSDNEPPIPPLKKRGDTMEAQAIEVETVDEDEDDEGLQSEEGPEDGEAEPTLPPSNKDGVHRKSETSSFATVDVSELLKRSFITLPDEDGEQHRAVIEEVLPTGETTADKTEPLFKFKAKVGSKVFEEVLTYNRMLDWCERDADKGDFYNFKGIVDHRRDPRNPRKWELLVHWESEEKTWEPFASIFGDDPVAVSMYARKNAMVYEWPCCKRYIKNSKTLARMANQAKLRTFRQQPKFKFGEQVPRNHAEAMKLDALHGDTRWADSEALEVSQLHEYESFKILGYKAPTPEGYTKIRCHFVYDIKHDGRFKSRFVAGGHMTDTPAESVYSGVVSIPGIRMVTFLAELNELELWAADIGNAYLCSVTKEKVCFTAGPEFGDKEGYTFLIYKAQYGLKTSGRRWHDRLYDVLKSMGFQPSKAEEDIWMRDAGSHYEYIAVYVDDLMIVSHDPKSIVDTLRGDPYNFKLKGVGPVSYHLGNDYFRDDDGTLCVGPKKYIEKMAVEYKRLFGETPSRKVSSPLDKNDHPELDDSPLLDDEGIRKYQSLIGTLQWTITLGRFDVGTAVMTMSSFRVAPREGHLERLRRICGYLYKMKNGFIRIRTEEPDYSDLPDAQYDWAKTVYGDVEEQVPEDVPPTRGKRVVMTTYKDANLYHDLTTGRAVTGVIHLLNQTPVDWFTKKQSTVETATYGSEFSAARTAIQQITALRLTLRYLGVEIHGATVMFGDNESVVKSGSLPHSPLHKRWHGLAYHYTREAVASGMVAFHHIPGEINPADILSKHWGYSQIWEQLQPLLFWEGNTEDLFTRGKTSGQ